MNNSVDDQLKSLHEVINRLGHQGQQHRREFRRLKAEVLKLTAERDGALAFVQAAKSELSIFKGMVAEMELAMVAEEQWFKSRSDAGPVCAAPPVEPKIRWKPLTETSMAFDTIFGQVIAEADSANRGGPAGLSTILLEACGKTLKSIHFFESLPLLDLMPLAERWFAALLVEAYNPRAHPSPYAS